MQPDIERAAAIIRSGGLVAFPTETVYGLGANALSVAAVDRIFAAKGRPPTSPLIVHVDSIDMAKSVVSEWPDGAEALARRYWPGPITLVLPKKSVVPDRVTAGLPTVGVRVPAHPVALGLIRASGVPIAAPSANRFSEISPTTAEHVRLSLGNAIDMILDGGPTDVGIESAVLSLAEPDRPVLLRPGVLARQDIESAIGPVSVVETGGDGAHASPGLHRRHYSPKTPVVVTSTPQGERVACVWWHREPKCERAIRMPADPAGYAQNLYDVLHTLDLERWEAIAVEPVPDDEAWAGVADRLRRASST